jgi:hypothetical protein
LFQVLKFSSFNNQNLKLKQKLNNKNAKAILNYPKLLAPTAPADDNSITTQALQRLLEEMKSSS